MEIISNRDKRTGVIATLLFHTLLLILFLIYGLVTPIPRPENDTLISLGFMDAGSGFTPPTESAAVASTTPEPTEEQPVETVAEAVPQEVETQDVEETIAVPKKKEKTPEEIEAERQAQLAAAEAEKKRIAEEIELKRQQEIEAKLAAMQNALKGGKGSGNDDTEGSAGDPSGMAGGAKTGAGKGGNGKGVSFALAGRDMGVVPNITPNTPEEGKVVVSIVVNRNGKVVKAIAGVQGSTTSDPTLLANAKKRAQATPFSGNPSAPEEQRGTMVFIYTHQ